MNKKRKALILLGIAIIAIVVSVVAYYALKPPAPPADFGVYWSFGVDEQGVTQLVVVNLINYNTTEDIIVERVELIYVPENINIVWNQQLILSRNMRSVEVSRKMDAEFLNFLWESRMKSDVKIVVESFHFGITKTIYTFVPSGWYEHAGAYTRVAVREKAEPLLPSVGNYVEYEYNFTGTYVGEMEGTARAEVIKVDGANYTVRVDYSPTDGSDAWTETFSCLLGEDFMSPLTFMEQAEHVADEFVQTKVGTVSVARYTTMGGIPEHDDAIYVHKESKILVLRTLDGQTVMEITDSDIEWL